MKRLYFDIETSPCLGWFWRPSHNMSLDYNNIIENAKIICICYKWADSKRVHWLTWDKKQSDKKMLQDFVKVLDLADEIVGHNSDKFDIKWIRTRCLINDVEMMPKYQTLDTLKDARNGFNFPSNRLDSIGRYTGVGKKIKTTGELWFDVWRKNCQKSLRAMVKYCKQDVLLLEGVHKKLNKHTEHKTNFNKLNEGYNWACPECCSEDVKFHKTRAGKKTLSFEFMCYKCRKYYTLKEKAFTDFKLFKSKND